MADEGYGRTFAGDPNAPPKGPRPSTAAVAEPPVTVDEPKTETQQAPSSIKHPKARLSVVDNGDGSRDVFAGSEKIGIVNIPGAETILDNLGTYNPDMKMWDDVPEDVAKQLMAGDLPLPAYLPAKYKANKAMIANGIIWTDWMRGKKTLEAALGEGDIESLKMRVKEAPLFVWQGDIPKTVGKMWADAKEAGPEGFARRIAGETAGAAAFMTDKPMVAAAGMTVAATIVASESVTGGLATPAVVSGVAFALKRGADAVVFRRSYEIEGGNAAADMIARGYEPETVKRLAPMVGVVNGALEVVGFHMLAAPFKRVLAGKMLASGAMRKVLAGAYVSYMKELGTEVSTEVAQEMMNIYSENLAADIENKPDLRNTDSDVLTRLGDITLKTMAGSGGLKAPGLALEAGVQRADAKAAASMDIKIAERAAVREKAAPVKPAAMEAPTPATPAAEPPSAPTATIDPSGDYFSSPETVKQLDELVKSPEAADFVQKADELLTSGEEAVEGLVPLTEEQKTKRQADRTLEQRTRDVEAKGRVEALRSEEAAVGARIDDLIKERDRFAKAGMGTKRIDEKISALMDMEQGIIDDIAFYENVGATGTVVEESATLSMKPATLEGIVKFGMKEGRKEVITQRAQAIKDVASRLDFTQADVRLLLKNKNIGLMGDVEFRNWMDTKFKKDAAAHAKRKIAKQDVRKTLKDRAVKNEKNIRALHELPTIGGMTTAQLFEYLDILNDYAPGSIALTPKRIRALETSELRGARTEQDVIRLAAGVVRVTSKEILAAQRSQFDPLRGDTELAESQPAYTFVVDVVQTAKAEAEAKHQKFERENFKLGAAALASRSSLLGRIVITMPEVMANLEADAGKVYTGEVIVPELTPQEEAYVDFLRGFFGEALGYLISTGELEGTRFKDVYAPHTRRPALEVLKSAGSIKELRAGIGEIVDGWMVTQKQIGGVEAVGPALGLRKFFRQTLFRTGELTPSTNVIKSANSYAKQFFEKQALDKAVPVVDSLFRAATILREDKSPDGELTMKAVHAFVVDYLNTKKGIQSEFTKLAPRGGYVDLTVRMLSGWVTLKSIALNLALQATAPIGETMATVPLLGIGGLLKTNATRMYSKQGRAILEKYEFFTGKGALDSIFEPGRNIDERLGTSMYAILQWNRARTMKTVLLGMMTDEEFAAGEISAKRLAEIKVFAGRWLDIPGMKSVVGATSLGAGYTKFRGWLIPILRTSLSDLSALLTPGRKMKPHEIADFYRVAETLLIGGAVIAAMGKTDDEDRSFTAQLRRKVAQEVLTLLAAWEPKTLAAWLAGGPIPQHVIQVGNAASLLLHLLLEEVGIEEGKARYQTGDKEGRAKAPAAIKKVLPFAGFARNLEKPKE